MYKYYPTKFIDKKQIRISRLVMEKYIKRKLKSNELVHHLNGNTTDNYIENLEIVSRPEHKKKHPEIGEKTRFKKKIFIDKEKLNELYVNQKLSMRKIAQKFNTTQPTVWRAIIKYQIKRNLIKCEICERKAKYVTKKLCYQCYQKEYRRFYRKNHSR